MIAAIGKFDALHRGHQALVEAARRLGEPVLLRFSGMAEALGWPPRLPLVAECDRPALIASWSARESVLPFAAIRSMDGPAFLAHLAALGFVGVVVGDDFRFGRDRGWSAADLPTLAAATGLDTAVVPAVLHDGQPISSSRIRTALEMGHCAEIAALLGRPYRVSGTVVRGEGRGRALGLPTCNITWSNQPPGGGVYAAWARLDHGQPLRAAVNAGHLPTIAGGRDFTVEAHLLDWTGDAYGRTLSLDLISRIRDEQRFPDLAALSTQIRCDIEAVRARLCPA